MEDWIGVNKVDTYVKIKPEPEVQRSRNSDSQFKSKAVQM